MSYYYYIIILTQILHLIPCNRTIVDCNDKRSALIGSPLLPRILEAKVRGLLVFSPPAQKAGKKGRRPDTEDMYDEDIPDEFYPPYMSGKVHAYGLRFGDLMFSGVLPDCGRFLPEWLTLKRKLCAKPYVSRMIDNLYQAVSSAAVAQGSNRVATLVAPSWVEAVPEVEDTAADEEEEEEEEEEED